MKVIGIKGSPRKGWNTQTLVNKALEVASYAGAEIELIDLYEEPVSVMRASARESKLMAYVPSAITCGQSLKKHMRPMLSSSAHRIISVIPRP